MRLCRLNCLFVCFLRTLKVSTAVLALYQDIKLVETRLILDGAKIDESHLSFKKQCLVLKIPRATLLRPNLHLFLAFPSPLSPQSITRLVIELIAGKSNNKYLECIT